MNGTTLVKLGLILAGALFIFAAIKPALADGGGLNVTFFVIGIACALIGFAVGRKQGGSTPSSGA